MLKNFWYALEFTHDVTRTPIKARVLGQDLVMYRKADGTVVAMSDLCVHRGGALSKGWVSGDCIVCPYHGWEYEPDGACVKIPANIAGRGIPKKARVDSYPTQEKYGFVWVFMGDLPEEERPPLPVWPEVDDTEHYRAAYGEVHWNANYERVIENGVDIAHTPFVHGSAFGNTDDPTVEEYVVNEIGEWSAAAHVALVPLEDRKVEKMGEWSELYETAAPEVSVDVQWWFPNTHKLQANLPMGTLIIYDTNIPVDETHTITKFCNLRTFFKDESGDQDAIDRTIKIFEQDKEVVESQRPELVPFDLSDELHVKSDAIQVAYRRRRRELIERGWGVEAHRVEGDVPRSVATVIPSPARRDNPELAHAWVQKETPARRR